MTPDQVDESYSDFPNAKECEVLNRSVRLRYADTPGDIPCIEVAGVQAYLYVDHKTGRMVVSIHRHGADERIVRDGDTVPQLEVIVDADTTLILN